MSPGGTIKHDDESALLIISHILKSKRSRVLEEEQEEQEGMENLETNGASQSSLCNS